ncbi:MAG: hypothetical protein GY869_29280, partial [Planctomycetes bacterium]|nr:hypothetical protein [Planctomycetota bacterium]
RQQIQSDLSANPAKFSPIGGLPGGENDPLWNQNDYLNEHNSDLLYLLQHGSNNIVQLADGNDLNAYPNPFPDLGQKMIASLVCHGGADPTGQYNWIDAYSEAGLPVYVSSTAYTYFSPSFVTYSERFLSDLSERMGYGSGTLGHQFWRSKMTYLNYFPAYFDEYDLKTVQSYVFYGLPMYSLNGSQRQTEDEPVASTKTEIRGTTLTVESLSFNDLASRRQLAIGQMGSFYMVDGQAAAGNNNVIIPVVEHETGSGTRTEGLIHGMRINSAAFIDDPDFDPVIDYAACEVQDGLYESTDFDADHLIIFPSPQPDHLSGNLGAYYKMVFPAGSFDGDHDRGELRLYNELDISLYFSTDSLD